MIRTFSVRTAFGIILFCLIAALLFCAHKARRSHKSIGLPVMHLLLALIPPMLGNLLLIVSTNRTLSTVGCYIYFLGMDLVMLALLQFTGAYCFIDWPKGVRFAIRALLGLDALQLLANLIFGHAFTIEELMAYNDPYFRLVPLLGQAFHRVVDYGILAAVLIIFFVKMLRSPRINAERYSVILISMIVVTVWQTLYIFSRTPVDRSMVGFGFFGLMVFYFALYYRPLRLLDRMLAAVASEIPDALYFFDMNDRCIWANKRGVELADIHGQDYETATDKLNALLGTTGEHGESWTGEVVSGTGDAMRSYVMTRRAVTDDKDRSVGSLLTVRDNSAEQKTLQREIYNATHDSLTQVYNRAGYDLLLSRLDLSDVLMLLIDGDNFKQVNDCHGHEMGDRTLQKIARIIERNFRSEDYVCRIGGDEFVVLMQHADETQYEQIRERIRHINDELGDFSDGIPPISISAGVALGSEAADGAKLFEHADRALYVTKRAGKGGITFFAPTD